MVFLAGPALRASGFGLIVLRGKPRPVTGLPTFPSVHAFQRDISRVGCPFTADSFFQADAEAPGVCLLQVQFPNMDEDELLLRAVRDSNKPKFLTDDITLFQGIISDVFFGTKEPIAA